MSLADFRDLFPSKGAMLAAFSRQIDRKVLDDLRDRGLRIRDLAGAALSMCCVGVSRRSSRIATGCAERHAMVVERSTGGGRAQPQVVNSMRFMLEAADIDSDGAVGALKLQGLAIAWRRVLNVFFEDREHDLSRTLSALDREISRGEKFIDRAEDFARLASPLRTLARAMMGGYRKRGRHDHDIDDDYVERDWRHHGSDARPSPASACVSAPSRDRKRILRISIGREPAIDGLCPRRGPFIFRTAISSGSRG